METQVKAIGKYLRISPKKVMKITGAVKGKSVEQAAGMLKFMPQKAAALLLKILNSSIANAEENNQLDIDDLIVKNIIVDGGPVLKRFRARARGRANRILKRTSHITVILGSRR
jgi:large subunit ribosomal protein L22